MSDPQNKTYLSFTSYQILTFYTFSSNKKKTNHQTPQLIVLQAIYPYSRVCCISDDERNGINLNETICWIDANRVLVDKMHLSWGGFRTKNVKFIWDGEKIPKFTLSDPIYFKIGPWLMVHEEIPTG